MPGGRSVDAAAQENPKMSADAITVRGAREHNLQSIDVDLPRNQLIVFTGLSGSGKSSLAFDTIFAEGQRRYVESLSAYARQFIGQLEKPDVDHIEGLSPAIAIDQKGISRNPRSTVGTVTEIYDYLRLLFARTGTPHCPNCGRVVTRQTVQQMVDAVLALPEGTRFLLLAPVVRDQRGEHRQVLDDARRSGYARVRIDGTVYRLDEELPSLAKTKRHTLEVVVDRLVVRGDQGTRLADSLETALDLGGGVVIVAPVTTSGTADELLFSEHFACVHCRISLDEIEPRTFSFNSPHGACPDCTGLGTTQEVDPDLLVPNPALSLDDGAIATSLIFRGYLPALATHYGFSLAAPVPRWTKRSATPCSTAPGRSVFRSSPPTAVVAAGGRIACGSPASCASLSAAIGTPNPSRSRARSSSSCSVVLARPVVGRGCSRLPWR